MIVTFNQQLLPQDDNCFEESGLDVYDPCDYKEASIVKYCFEESGLDVYDPCDYKEASIVKYCSAKKIAQSPQQRLSDLS